MLARCPQRILQRLIQHEFHRTVYISSRSHVFSSYLLTTNNNNNPQSPFIDVRQFSKGKGTEDKNVPPKAIDLEAQQEDAKEQDDLRIITEEANDDDPFGISFTDGEDNLGPTLPPSYKRDPTTGKFTGETEEELTEEERRVLTMTEEEKLEILQRRFIHRKDWDEEKEREVARSVQNEESALNVLGRNKLPPRMAHHTLHDDPDAEPTPPSSSPLSPEEFASFQKFLKESTETEISEDDIPVQKLSSTSSDRDTGHDVDQDLTWVKPNADAWMEEIMPHHLSPLRKLNRREAKPLPKSVLHHNNLELLRRYITPGGQILNRYKSRLGAKDQRKIAKLIKRARHLGLIPHIGQWKLEDCGDVSAVKDKRWWEEELEGMGLYLDGKRPREEERGD